MTQLDHHPHQRPTRGAGVAGALHAVRRALRLPNGWPGAKGAPGALPLFERHLSAAIDALPQHVFVKDAQGRYLEVNTALAAYFGRTPAEFIGKRVEELPFMFANQVPIFSQSDAEVLATGRQFLVPRLVTHDPGHGEIVWRYAKFAFRDDNASIVGTVGFLEDITERVRAEEALLASRRLLQTVVDTLPQAMLVKDRHGRFIMANKALAEFYGLTPQQVVGLTTRELPSITVEEAELMRKSDAQAMQTREPVDLAEVPMTGFDGRASLRHVVKYPLKDEQGAVTGVIGMCEDITERKRNEAELSRMAAAVEHAGDAILIADGEGVIQYVNPAFESLTGYSRAEAVGHTPNLFKSGKPGADFYEDLLTTLREGRIWKARYTNRRKDGGFYETESTHSPIRNAQGEITGFVGVQKDVTQQAQLEEQLRRSQRMEALGTLAGGIAHDFNNILTPVLGYAELMRDEFPPESRQGEYLRLIREAGQRGRDLVSKILQFGRQTESPRRVVNLAAVAEQVLTLLRAAIPKSIAIHSSIAEGLSPIVADATEVHQVLMNLCVNAMQAMPQGGALTVAMDAVELSDHTCYLGKRISGPFVRLTVADTGTGMPEEVMSHIFEPFYTTKEVGQGTGLGLSTVFGIVQQHGGVIDLRSRVGEGSTFCVYLPVAAPDLPPAAGAGE